MVERSKRRSGEELSQLTTNGEMDSDPQSHSEASSEDDEMEVDSMPVTRSRMATRRKQTQTPSVDTKATPSRSRKLSERSNPELKKTTIVRPVEDEECDSASVDSTLNLSKRCSANFNIVTDCSPEQLLELVDDVVRNGDSDDLRPLERLLRHIPSSSMGSPSNLLLDESTATQLLDILMRHTTIASSSFGYVRWLTFLVGPGGPLVDASPNSKSAAILKKPENRLFVKSILQRSHSVSQQCLRLRGKLDLLLAGHSFT